MLSQRWSTRLSRIAMVQYQLFNPDRAPLNGTERYVVFCDLRPMKMIVQTEPANLNDRSSISSRENT